MFESLIISTALFWSYLVLVSIGLQFIFGVLRILNLAHGSLFVAGGFLASILATRLGDLIVAIIFATLFGFLAGLGFSVYVKLSGEGELKQLLSTFALFWLLEGVYKLLFGYGLYNTYDYANLLGSLKIGGQIVPASYLAGMAIVVMTLTTLYILIKRTTFGVFLRAVIDEPEMAEALGIDVGKIALLGSAIGVATTTLGGAVSSMWQNFSIGLAGEILIYAFAAVAISGVGNIFGVVASSLIISAIRTLAIFYAPEFELFAIYVAVIATLALRPLGLFVKHERRV